MPRSGRGGDHPSSPDVTIGVKRPTRGSRPSTLSLSRSPETSGQLGPLIRSCSGWGLSSQPVSQSLVSSYLAISPLPAPRCYRGRWRFVSVALSVGSPLLGVTQHPARWSSDFPPQLHGAVTRFTRPDLFYSQLQRGSNSGIEHDFLLPTYGPRRFDAKIPSIWDLGIELNN